MPSAVRNNTVLAWQAPEFFYYAKGPSWYGGAVAIGALVIIALWLLKSLDWTNAGLVVAGVAALWWLSSRPPRTIQIRIQQQGVQIGENFTPYEQISSFHLTNHDTHLTVDFQSRRNLFPLSAVITEQDPERVRTTLGQFLPEKTTDNSYISDILGRWLRF